MRSGARGWLCLAGAVAVIACSSEEMGPIGASGFDQGLSDVAPIDSPPDEKTTGGTGAVAPEDSGSSEDAQHPVIEQLVKCKLKGELIEFEYQLTRYRDGTAEVFCRAAWNGPGVQYPGPLEVTLPLPAGGDPFGRCRLAPLITEDGYVELFRTEASLEQEIINPATVRHGGVYVDLEYGDSRGEWWMEDADPSRGLEGDCKDSKGN